MRTSVDLVDVGVTQLYNDEMLARTLIGEHVLTELVICCIWEALPVASI